MTSRARTLLLFGLLAAAAAAVFFAIAVDSSLYAPGSTTLRHNVDLHDIRDALPASVAGEITWGVLLRKLYSVVAFTVIGFFAAPLFEARQRHMGATLLVAFFSVAIEIGQKFVDASAEGLASNLFDVACGASGGFAGSLLWGFIPSARRPPDDLV